VPADAEARRLLGLATAQATGTARRNDACPCGSGKRYKHCCGHRHGSVAPAPTVDVLLAEAMRCHQAGRLHNADALYGQVLRLEPANAFALHYTGVLAMQWGDPRRGETLVRQALAARADIPDFHNNLGLCLRLQDRLDEAVAAYQQALRLNPKYPEGENNLGLDLLALGRAQESVAHCQRAIALRPDFAEAHWNLGLGLLTLGDLGRGWAEYEWRLKCQPFESDGLILDAVAMWQGEPLPGKTLLVRREQGFGDTLQFLRFVPELVQRGARVLLDVNPELADLAMTVAPTIERVSRDRPLPHVDYYTNLMSLPFRLGVALGDLPGPTAYLTADVALCADWTSRVAAASGLRVGLVWAGNPRHRNDRNRSCKLSELAALKEVPGVSWFSLQKGEASAQKAGGPFSDMVDLAPQLNSFSDTAAAIMALDLVIAVDTSVAHLAGALGRPVWLMLPFAPDWRWLLGREDTPWYPSARLFRQVMLGDWHGVAASVARALAKLDQ
jgi:tetratricopeptide (TPR) repeat protein